MTETETHFDADHGAIQLEKAIDYVTERRIEYNRRILARALDAAWEQGRDFGRKEGLAKNCDACLKPATFAIEGNLAGKPKVFYACEKHRASFKGLVE